jgi:cytochrome c peroxidase
MRFSAALSFLILIAAQLSVSGARAALLDLSPGEKEKILRHGPWPPQPRKDPSNRVSGNPAAIALGETLFFEPRLSGTGSVLCATCHVPYRSYQDARARAFGLEAVERNTPTVLDVGRKRWYGWDGANDSLWAQSIRPLLDPREMRASAAHVSRTVRRLLSRNYEEAFGRAPPADDEELLVDVGKALAAYEETLVSARTPFDDFRDALEKGDAAALQRYPLAAQRGLRLFVGKASCAACHLGPAFTNGEFSATPLSSSAARGRVDAGRHDGIRKLKASPYNLLGRFNDDPSRATAAGTQLVELQPRNFGEWRVPGLRNVARTAPYMHDGSVATLRDVVQRHSRLDLAPDEIDELIAFLESLSSP